MGEENSGLAGTIPKQTLANGEIEAFERSESLYLVIPPEGTRSRVERWKTGFYRIADRAGVPILLGFLDFGRRVGGLGHGLSPQRGRPLGHRCRAWRQRCRSLHSDARCAQLSDEHGTL